MNIFTKQARHVAYDVCGDYSTRRDLRATCLAYDNSSDRVVVANEDGVVVGCNDKGEVTLLLRGAFHGLHTEYDNHTPRLVPHFVSETLRVPMGVAIANGRVFVADTGY